MSTFHPAYFETRFHATNLTGPWPDAFLIISAYATTGQQWSDAVNEQADGNMQEILVTSGIWHQRIVGYSPLTGHAEPSWAVNMELDAGLRLARRFHQDALYEVVRDHLWVVKCSNANQRQLVGHFSERLDRSLG